MNENNGNDTQGQTQELCRCGLRPHKAKCSEALMKALDVLHNKQREVIRRLALAVALETTEEATGVDVDWTRFVQATQRPDENERKSPQSNHAGPQEPQDAQRNQSPASSPQRPVARTTEPPMPTGDEGQDLVVPGSDADKVRRPQAPYQEPDYEKLPPPGAGSPATEKQVQAIYAVARAKLRLSEGQTDDRSVEIYGVRPSELTKNEASNWLDQLNGRPQAARR